MNLQTAEGFLAARPPFRFDKALGFLSGFKPAYGEVTIDDGVLTRAVMIDGEPLVFAVSAAEQEGMPGLRCRLTSPAPLDPARVRAAEDRIAFYLSLDDDLTPFYAAAEDDPSFAPIAAHLHGYHQAKFLTPFENAVWAILTQRNHMTLARRMKDALTSACGAELSIGGTTYRAFPEAPALAALSDVELGERIGHRPKGAFVGAVARAFAGVDEAFLRYGPVDEVERWLRRISGIGAWSASFVLVRGLGRMERLPEGDAALIEAAARVYGRTLTAAELRRLAAHYGAYQGYWAHYLRAAG